MVSRRRLFNILTLLIVIGFFVAACERPIPGSEDAEDTTTETTDPDAGGGVGEATDTGQPDTETAEQPDAGGETADTGADTGEAPADTAADTPTEAETTEDEAADAGETETTETDQASDTTEDPDVGGGVGEVTEETETGEETAATTEETETTTEETTETTADTTTATTTEIPATHTVAAGENLYRIGLKYGISWVSIAQLNQIPPPYTIYVGQTLNLPSSSGGEPTPTPSSYVVQPGDNLFRIGLKYGISWVQLAEANGLINPNLIEAGDTLKIPVSTPGPAPNFTHTVKPGETLFLISLRYGVPWPTIADANDIVSPYVIYVGQTLTIPGE